MRRAVAIVALSLMLLNNVSVAEETSFTECKLADAKGKEVPARLILSDNSKQVEIQVSDRDVVTIPYDSVDKFSYEYTKKHRITQGAIIMIASLGAGAVVMLTKSKSHWLYIDYHVQTAHQTVVLRMDKKEYEKIIAAIKTHTGRDVEMIGDASKKNKN